MIVIVNGPSLAETIRADREQSDDACRDEVWEGIYVESPIVDLEHQWTVAELLVAVHSVLALAGGGKVVNGLNVSDRVEGWRQNFRVPDVVVLLDNNPGQDCDAHFCGGPDFVVEIVSPNDLAREKREFYSKIGVRELLVIDRAPWALELYRLEDETLSPAGRSSLAQPDLLSSTVLPLTFRLVDGPKRPRIEVARADGARTWLA